MTRGQILHLLQLAERPNLTVQALRRDVPNNPILGGSLSTLDLGDAAPRIAFSPVTYGPSTYHDQEKEAGPMFRALDRERELPPPSSRRSPPTSS
ncbi:Scr1 family TA system antitoxin-like transcriptional regulator [Halosaccharopolyspora lacisalsi]|uniref:Scr1 family TA system antitoxin-like transcriptional regulator n=1 Tax=Halosaccharopolyspora lacisalsi TaxID=1000566 RepID=UPI0038B3B5E8